jgi:DNA-binding beta-propeller fold protein YncE
MRTWNLQYACLAILLAISQANGASPEPLTLVKIIPLKGVAGKLDHLAVDSKGERLYVANKTNNTLDVVDLANGKLIRQVSDQGKVSGVAYSADLNLVYVGNGAGTCNAFDRQDFKQAFSTPTPNADNIHYYSGTQTVYVGQDEILSELDAKTGAIKASIQLPGAVHGFKIDKKAGKIYAVLTNPNLVAVVDIAKREVTDKFELTLSDAGSPVAQDSENGLLFVGCPKKKPMVVVFDLKNGKEVAQIDIPAGVDDIHYDKRGHRLYASCGAGALVAIERSDDGYKVVTQMEVPKDSRTCAWSSGHLYLGVPRQEGKEGPEVWVYESAPKE